MAESRAVSIGLWQKPYIWEYCNNPSRIHDGKDIRPSLVNTLLVPEDKSSIGPHHLPRPVHHQACSLCPSPSLGVSCLSAATCDSACGIGVAASPAFWAWLVAACSLWSKALRANALRLSASARAPPDAGWATPPRASMLDNPPSPLAFACELPASMSAAEKGVQSLMVTRQLYTMSATAATGSCKGSGKK